MIIAIVGMPGAGKSTLVDVGTQQFGLPRVYFGGFVTREVQRRGLAISAGNEKLVREDLRHKYGMSAMAQLALPDIAEALRACPDVLLDGLYSWSEWVLLAAEFKDKFVTVAVHAPRRLRYQRLACRAVRPLTAPEAAERDRAEIERLEKGGPIAVADHVLTNDGLPETFSATCACTLAALCSSPIPLTPATAAEGFAHLDAPLQDLLLSRIRFLDNDGADRFYLSAYDQVRHPETRGPILKALAELHSPETSHLIAALLRTGDPASRRTAIGAIGETRNLARIPLLATALGSSDDPAEITAAADALAKMGEPAAPALHDLLGASSSPEARLAALDAVLTIASPTSEPQVQQLAGSFTEPEKLLFLDKGDAYFNALRATLLEWSRSGHPTLSAKAAAALSRSG